MTNSFKKSKVAIILAGLLVFITFCAVLSSFSYVCEENKSSVPVENTFFVPTVPEHVDFCGEKVPLHNFDVYESLERELIVNAYWHSQTILFLKKANRYFLAIEPILKANNIPADFKYLVVVESGFSDIVSPAGAAGLWHFLEGTAREYGLELNEEVDERYHIEKSTEAACKYLQESFNIYKNWTLVAASYNGGRRGIDRQIIRQGENNYYDLLFAEETARYVYRILAIKLVLENPEEYGFFIDNDEIYKPVSYSELKINSGIEDIGEFAKMHGTNYKLLKFLNPWLRDSKLTNTQKKEYTIKIPLSGSRELTQ